MYSLISEILIFFQWTPIEEPIHLWSTTAVSHSDAQHLNTKKSRFFYFIIVVWANQFRLCKLSWDPINACPLFILFLSYGLVLHKVLSFVPGVVAVMKVKSSQRVLLLFLSPCSCAGKAKGSPAAVTENALASTNNASQRRWESIMTPHMPNSAMNSFLTSLFGIKSWRGVVLFKILCPQWVLYSSRLPRHEFKREVAPSPALQLQLLIHCKTSQD